jgi:transposase
MGTDLSDAQWERIRPLLPAVKPTGIPRGMTDVLSVAFILICLAALLK